MGSQPKTEMTVDTGHETFSTSELRRLSSDPAITRHPDPGFHFKFRDPDELGEEESVELVVNSTTPARRACPTTTDWLLRRSPKE
jgi:hypothetical protein